MLNQFDERFAQWIEDAYAAMSQRAFVFVRETKSLSAAVEPEALDDSDTTPEQKEADAEAVEAFIAACREMTGELKKLKEA